MSEKATIGITCYNAGATIVRAIQSALTQDYRDKEIIIVDDFSTDNSWQLIQDCIQKNPDEIRAYKLDSNSGVAAARNKIIENASGKYLVFFDDDDVSSGQRVSKQIQRIADYKNQYKIDAPIICHCARTKIYSNGDRRYEQVPGGENAIAPHGINMARKLLYNKPLPDAKGSMPTCVQAGITQDYRRLGGFDVEFRRSEDTEYNIRLALHGGHFVGIEESLVDQNMNKSDDKPVILERKYHALILQKYKKFLDEEGRNNFDYAWLQIKHDYLEGKNGLFAMGLLKIACRHPILAAKKSLYALPNLAYNHSEQKFNRHE